MALQYFIEYTVATKVNVGTNTSSELLTPKTLKPNYKADVPELVAIVYLEPVNLQISFSNF